MKVSLTMRAVTSVVATSLLVLIGSVAQNEDNLTPPERSYKILFLIPFGLNSHRNTMLPIARALAERKHEVVMLSGLAPANIHPKVKEIQHQLFASNDSPPDFFTRRKNPSSTFFGFSKILPKIAAEIYDDPQVQKLYEQRETFDLIVIDEFFNEFAYPFLHERTFIFISPIGLNPATGAVLGNVLHPSYVPGISFNKFPPFSFWERLMNLYDHLHFSINWRYIHVVPKVQKEISKRFPNLPPLLEIEKNVSLVLVQSHFTLRKPTPLLPTQIEIAGHICRKPKPLSSVIKEWIEGAEFGVVYFSLGSVVQAHKMPEEYFTIFMEAFQKLQQRVVWKYESNITQIPPNALISKWLPQQDIISHPNVKLFITHGGFLSLIESTCHGIPLIVIPIVGDQIKNADYITKNELGETLIWEEMTAEGLVNTIHRIIDDERYSNSMRKASEQLLDQQEPPLQRAVWWTEYVIRHRGAHFLKSPGADLSVVEYFLIDVILTVAMSLMTILYLIKRLFVYLLKYLRRNHNLPKYKTE